MIFHHLAGLSEAQVEPIRIKLSEEEIFIENQDSQLSQQTSTTSPEEVM